MFYCLIRSSPYGRRLTPVPTRYHIQIEYICMYAFSPYLHLYLCRPRLISIRSILSLRIVLITLLSNAKWNEPEQERGSPVWWNNHKKGSEWQQIAEQMWQTRLKYENMNICFEAFRVHASIPTCIGNAVNVRQNFGVVTIYNWFVKTFWSADERRSHFECSN